MDRERRDDSQDVAGKSAYWNDFYADKARKFSLDLPSQFALFFLGEIERGTPIVDFGCGTGRDALYFAGVGSDVVGVDGSSSAVELCREKANDHGHHSARFVQGDLAAPETLALIRDDLRDASPALYARFFLHAITEEAEAAFLSIASELIGESIFALEFRTSRDAQQQKTTARHYRRFVDPLDFIRRAARYGLSPSYFVEGFGYAKFRSEDAHVARIILRRDGG